jgi:hypothetical protein
LAALSRQEALTILEDGHERLLAQFDRLSDDDAVRPGTIGGGEWSAKDLIGHIATWEALALRSLIEWRSGEMPWVERADGPFSAPTTGKVDAFNAKTVSEKAGAALGEIRADAQKTHRDLIEAIESLSDREWAAKAFYPTPNGRRRKLGTLLGSVLGAPQGPFAHALAHLPDLAAHVRSR